MFAWREASVDVTVPSGAGTFTTPGVPVGSAELLEAVRHCHAVLRTALAGANNDLDYVATRGGTGGTGVTVAYVNAGASKPLAVTVTGSAISVQLATDAGSVITSTAAQVAAAVRASDAAGLVRVQNAPGNDGTGLVTALAATALAAWAGTAPVLDAKLQISADNGATYYDAPEGGFAQATGLASDGASKAWGTLPDYLRWSYTVGGTGPVLAFSIASKRNE